MRNKQIITRLVKGGDVTLLHAWKGNEVIDCLNKQWVILLPPNAGIGDVIDSPTKVTIDLSKAAFGVGGGSIETFYIIKDLGLRKQDFVVSGPDRAP